MKTNFFVTLALGATLFSPAAKAQGVFNMGGLTGTLSTDAVTQSEEKRAGIRRGTPSTGKVRKRRVGKLSVLHGTTRFRVSRATRRRMAKAWIARRRAVDPKGTAGLERQLAGRGLLEAVQPQIAKYGLRTDDLADSMAVYLVAAWYGSRGSQQDPPRELLLATRSQMRAAMLLNPKFASVSDATKQQLADSLLIQTIEDNGYLNAGKKSPAEMAQAKKLIRQGALKNFQLDMLKLNLTSRGLRA